MSREPIPNTCPDIDIVLRAIQNCVKACTNFRGIDEDDPEALKERLSEIESELWGVDGILEKLRESNSKLRDWGSGEASEVDYLTEKYENAQSIAADIIDGLCPTQNAGLIELLKNI